MQIRNEVATMRYRSNGNWSLSISCKSTCWWLYTWFICITVKVLMGILLILQVLKVAYPSNASDAKGLLKYACRCDDPVLFFEHKGMYRQGFASSEEPD